LSEETTSLDKFVEDTNRRILDEMRRVYTPQVVERFLDPRNPGPMADANGHARVTGPCGDTMEIWLGVEGELVVRASFMTDGCGPTVVCGSMATELAAGRTLEDAARVGQADILDALGGLPEESLHCALLAADALRAAVADYHSGKKEATGGGG
jgi:nitrogen fixation NifU-like protein